MKKNIQLTHEAHHGLRTKFPLSIIANDMTDPLNVGSLFRLSDALGIEKLYLCGDTPAPPNAKIKKTSRSTEKHTDFESHTDAEKLLRLVLGSENTGVSESLLSLSDITTHIPMYGNNSSMNVVSAASIACYEIIRNLL